jgi:hypothetical protein
MAQNSQIDQGCSLSADEQMEIVLALSLADTEDDQKTLDKVLELSKRHHNTTFTDPFSIEYWRQMSQQCPTLRHESSSKLIITGPQLKIQIVGAGGQQKLSVFGQAKFSIGKEEKVPMGDFSKYVTQMIAKKISVILVDERASLFEFFGIENAHEAWFYSESGKYHRLAKL